MIYGDTSYEEVRDRMRENEQQENPDYTANQWPDEDRCKCCDKCGLPGAYVFGFSVCVYCDQPRRDAINEEYAKLRTQGYNKRSANQAASAAHSAREWYRHLRDVTPSTGNFRKVV